MAVDQRGVLDDDVFDYRATKSGTVLISWKGRLVTTLKGAAATKFLQRISGVDRHTAQLIMAKATGHFKHGNERTQKPRG